MTVLFIISTILMIYFLIFGIKEFLKSADNFRLYIGIFFLVSSLELGLSLNIRYFDKIFVPVIIWAFTMFFLIVFSVSKKKCCSNVKNIINLLNETKNYKEIADKLFVGFINFEYSMPPKYNSEEKSIYEEGFSDFCCLDLSGQSNELIELQNLVRWNKIHKTLVIAFAISFILQIVPLTIVSK